MVLIDRRRHRKVYNRLCMDRIGKINHSVLDLIPTPQKEHLTTRQAGPAHYHRFRDGAAYVHVSRSLQAEFGAGGV